MGRRRKKIFLTGGTGTWGRQTLREFSQRADRFDVVALVLPTARDRAVISEFAGMGNLTIVYGDITDRSVVESCVRGAEYVLHLGAIVSPLADDQPELTYRVNVGGTRVLIQAVKAQPDPHAIGVVMVGSVAQTGDRNPPHHWGRVGDPVRAAQYDQYAQSKIAAERELVDSSLCRWVWLRQTGIFHPGLLEVRDPIMTHTPLAGTMEWVSVEDSARLIANICEDGVPEQFWGAIYNVGGGPAWRLTNWELMTRVAGALGVGDVRRWYDRNWFATRNFHGHWYTDSDRLEHLVPFRRDTVDQALSRAVNAAPRSVRLAGTVPAWLVKRFVMRPLTHRPRGTMSWIDADDDAHIRAYFGSRDAWQDIGTWATFQPPTPSHSPRLLDHGYDESKDPAQWSIQDLRDAAAFRGGQLHATCLPAGGVVTPLRWRCADGHAFTASPRLVLTGGHWCPTCVRGPANYGRQARRNQFLAQVEG
ncbi:MAG TPA: NAD(P)-dependent oxidoreductase [Rugosimonospora sp.]|nr:NAD(P)-dependent oxidoreductase [Rugosimonospora sp.]